MGARNVVNRYEMIELVSGMQWVEGWDGVGISMGRLKRTGR